jgi:2'-5' RNA ligase
VNPAGSVARGERLRLFVGFPLPRRAVEDIQRWQAGFPASAGRVVAPDNLHVTVAFLGSRPVEDVQPIVGELVDAAARARPIALTPLRYRETRTVGMLVFDDARHAATRVAERVQKRLERLGAYKREVRPWLPHVTVLRFRVRPRLALETPDLGAVSPSDLALYHSVLRSTGAQYEILESVALGGKEH